MRALIVGNGDAFAAVGKSRLANCKFDIFDTSDDLKVWNKLAAAQDEKHFSRDPYQALEAYYRGKGLKQLADEIYYDGRRKDHLLIQPGVRRTKMLAKLSWAFTGYGVRLRRLGWWIAIFLLLGTAVFWADGALVPAKRDAQKAQQTPAEPRAPAPALETFLPAPLPKFCRRFGYSLGSLLPLVDLRLAKDWEPVGDWRRAYLAIHIAAGWIFFPLLLAGITAQLNKN
jgi:hypothetical protein